MGEPGTICGRRRCQGKEYSCSMELSLAVIGGKWKPLILWHLRETPTMRFSALRRTIPAITQKMLTQQLRGRSDGLLTRTVFAEVPPRVRNMRSPTWAGASFPSWRPCAVSAKSSRPVSAWSRPTPRPRRLWRRRRSSASVASARSAYGVYGQQAQTIHFHNNTLVFFQGRDTSGAPLGARWRRFFRVPLSLEGVSHNQRAQNFQGTRDDGDGPTLPFSCRLLPSCLTSLGVLATAV